MQWKKGIIGKGD